MILMLVVPPASSVVMKKRKKYDTDFKLKVIEYAEKSSNREAGSKVSVGDSCIKDRRRNK